MITFERQVAWLFRAALRKCFDSRSGQADQTRLQIRLGPDGLMMHAAAPEIVLIYRQPAPTGNQVLSFPVSHLAEIEGRAEDLVTIAPQRQNVATARWTERGRRREVQIPLLEPDKGAQLPEPPMRFATLPGHFLSAYHQASESADSHLADDVLQATFLLLARQCRSIRKRDSMAGWLYRVAQRLARQVQLAEAARSKRERLAAMNRPRTTDCDPAWDELCLVLDEELRGLPERYRVPLLLCYLEGQTQDEAAKHLGWSVRTLRRRLERARSQLKAKMIRRGATLGAGLFAGFLAPSANAVLPTDLRQSILSTVFGGAKGTVVSATALAMVNATMRMVLFTRIAIWSAIALAIGGAAVGMIQLGGLATEATQPTSQTSPPPADRKAEAPAAGRDQFNDRLPEGAVARLGTVAFRHGGLSGYQKSLTFTGNGRQLVSMGGGWIRRWDLATGKETLSFGDGWPQGIVDADGVVTPDGKAACLLRRVAYHPEKKRECTQYDLESGMETRTYQLDPSWQHFYYHIFSPDGRTCASIGSSPATIVFWNAADGAILHEFKPKKDYTSVAFAPDGKSLIAGDGQHTIHIVDVATGKESRSFGVAKVKVIDALAVSPDGKNLATAGAGDTFIRLWDLAKGTEQRTCDLPQGFEAVRLLFTSDSRALIVSGYQQASGGRSAVYSWNVESGKPARSWKDQPMMGLILAVSPDGKLLATMNGAGVIRLWDWETGNDLRPRAASPCSLGAICFRPDGKTMLTAGDDLAIREWDAASGRLLGPVHTKTKGSARKFSADGKFLISEKDEQHMWLQDAATGKVLFEALGTQGALSSDVAAAWRQPICTVEPPSTTSKRPRSYRPSCLRANNRMIAIPRSASPPTASRWFYVRMTLFPFATCRRASVNLRGAFNETKCWRTWRYQKK